MITTKSLGLDSQNADPKPVSGFDYAGQIMKPGDFYNGRPEHQSPNESQTTPVVSDTPVPTPTVRRVKRKRIMSPERKAKLRQYMHDYWQRRKAAALDSKSSVSPS